MEVAGRLFIVCTFLVAVNALEPTKKIYITYGTGLNRLKLHAETPKHVPLLAYGSFHDATNSTGWATLDVWTNGSYPDKMQAYAAGLMEGAFTRQMIVLAWHNMLAHYCKPLSDYCKRLSKFITANAVWMQTQIDQHAGSDPYWHQVDLFYTQLNGLRDGFHDRVKSPDQPLINDPLDMFVLLQLAGDLEDLQAALNSSLTRVLGSGSCSALIKLLPGNTDLLTSQDTWMSYSAMLRVLKKYDLNFRPTATTKDETRIPGHAMSMSSSPGSLTSGDDFYIISSGLVTLETTIGNGNASLWQFVKPETVFEWTRSMVANRLATSGKEWTSLFAILNSGTYNNQWMVVDYKRFTPGNPKLDPELFYIAEQLPGFVKSGSVTDVLQRQSYWPSYNVAYFPEIFHAGGDEENVKKYGPWFTYNETARANIFRRDHVKVKDIPTMIKVMRYNDYEHDPLSKCNCTPPYSAENAISARSDLNPANGKYPFSSLGHRNHGGIDMKLTSMSMMKKLQFIAISSPAYDNVPPFQWSKTDFGNTSRHLGQPDYWRFAPVLTSWSPLL